MTEVQTCRNSLVEGGCLLVNSVKSTLYPDSQKDQLYSESVCTANQTKEMLSKIEIVTTLKYEVQFWCHNLKRI